MSNFPKLSYLFFFFFLFFLFLPNCPPLPPSPLKLAGTSPASSSAATHTSLQSPISLSLPFSSLFLSLSFPFHITTATTTSDPLLASHRRQNRAALCRRHNRPQLTALTGRKPHPLFFSFPYFFLFLSLSTSPSPLPTTHGCCHLSPVATTAAQSLLVRGRSSSSGSLAVVAVVMWKGKERERNREGKGRERGRLPAEGDCEQQPAMHW